MQLLIALVMSCPRVPQRTFKFDRAGECVEPARALRKTRENRSEEKLSTTHPGQPWRPGTGRLHQCNAKPGDPMRAAMGRTNPRSPGAN